MTSIQEPNVNVFIRDRSTPVSSDQQLSVALVIDSTAGPTTPQLVQSQAELLDLYSSNLGLSGNDDITFKCAYKLLEFTPVYLSRASNSNIVVGISNEGDTLFKSETEQYDINTQIEFSNLVVDFPIYMVLGEFNLWGQTTIS